MVFTQEPAAHLGSLATGHGVGTISGSSGITRFVQGGVVKTFRCTLDTPMKLIDRRDRLFAYYERGALTATSVEIDFVDLMLEAPDDASALLLCESLPNWFREHFRDSLKAMEGTDYQRHSFAMGDQRSTEQVENDAKRHGQLLQRLASVILGML